MNKAYAAMLAIILIVGVVALDMAVHQRTAEDVAKFVIGTIYRSFAADPPPYYYVDQLAAQPPGSENPRLIRLQGYAVSIERRGQHADFRLERNGHSVRVSYSGVFPQGFIEGNEVVVTGALRDGVELQATQLAARIGE